MSKIVQIGGESLNIELAYVGPERELRADMVNKDLRLHDGVTPGGHKILSENSSDWRYQARSDELSGLSGFAPEDRGFLARHSDGQYRIRAIAVNGQQLTVTNSDGHSGDPVIGLAGTITTPHIFADDLTVQGEFKAPGGITGNVTGNVFGNVEGDITGDVTGNVQGNVAGNLTGNSNGSHTGAVDVRGKTLQLDNEQIPTNKIAGLATAMAAVGVPVGAILLWSGSIVSIPANWALCNGANGTPDLRDRFVVGSGTTYAPGASGGALSHAHNVNIANSGAHDHGLAVAGHSLTVAEMPAHSHEVFTGGGSSGTTKVQIGSGANVDLATSVKGGGTPHSHGLTQSGNGAHSHNNETATVNHLPPYYALAYIMKVA